MMDVEERVIESDDTVIPRITSEQQESLRMLWEIWEHHKDRISKSVAAFVDGHAELSRLSRMATEEQRKQAQAYTYQLQVRAVNFGEWGPLVESLEEQGARYAHMGIGFRTFIELIGAVRRILGALMLDEFGNDSAAILKAGAGMAIYLDTTLAAIGEGYLKAKEAIIQKQQNEIQQLSTPVLQLETRLLVLPLIGTIDTERAQQITGQLLDAIRERHARVAVIDVTGVANAGEQLAYHLIRTVESARLMGVTVIVTGLSTESARSLVNLGEDLTKLNTSGDLQSGVEKAQRLLNIRPEIVR